MTQQARDFRWFKDNCGSIFKQYGDSYVAIKDGKVLGAYRTYADGVHETEKSEPLGTFIVQHCTGNVSGYTGYIASTNFMPLNAEGAAP